MKTKIKYTNELLGEVKVIPHLLPSTAELPIDQKMICPTMLLTQREYINEVC